MVNQKTSHLSNRARHAINEWVIFCHDECLGAWIGLRKNCKTFNWDECKEHGGHEKASRCCELQHYVLLSHGTMWTLCGGEDEGVAEGEAKEYSQTKLWPACEMGERDEHRHYEEVYRRMYHCTTTVFEEFSFLLESIYRREAVSCKSGSVNWLAVSFLMYGDDSNQFINKDQHQYLLWIGRLYGKDPQWQSFSSFVLALKMSKLDNKWVLNGEPSSLPASAHDNVVTWVMIYFWKALGRSPQQNSYFIA